MNRNNSQLKLNLGCGGNLKKDYLNIDVKKETEIPNPNKYDYREGDCGDLHFISDKSVDEIYTKYLIEHIHVLDIKEYLFEWRRVLKEDGELVLIFPDFDKIVNAYSHCKELQTLDDFMELLSLIYHLLNPTQKNLVKSDQHRSIATIKLITVMLNSEGFKILKQEDYGSEDEKKFVTMIRARKIRCD